MSWLLKKFSNFPRLGRNALFALVLAVSVGDGWGQTGLTLHGDLVEGEVGDNITLLFRTEGFWQITEGMGTLQWDPDVIDYVDAGDFGIPALDGGSFSRVPEGMLIFDWNADGVLGNTLPDGTILFSLTFAIRGAPGDSTTVAFTDGWTPLHFESAENINLPFSSAPGKVSVVPEPSTALLATCGLVLAAVRRGRKGPETDQAT